jgi:hypothetical protein
MGIINRKLVYALVRVVDAMGFKSGGLRDRMRPVPMATVEKYHCAMWALDVLGPTPGAGTERSLLDTLWKNATLAAENASGPDGGKIATDIIATLNSECERVLQQCEKDRERQVWEKQRDFLVGSLKRVRRAAALNDIEHLHYYKKQDTIFSVDMRHPNFQIGYDVWQGLVTELKESVTRALYSDKPPHARVEYLLGECRKLIWALEAGDVSKLEGYVKSPLHLSKEEEGRVLWEGFREHAAKVLRTAGAV